MAPERALPTPAEVEAADGGGVTVLVVDSGVDAAHPDLAGAPVRAWRTAPCEPAGYRVVADEGGDAFGHGTAVAAILRRHAPGAAIESLKVLGSDLLASSQRILAALAWAVERGYDVVNCSFGTSKEAFLPFYKEVVDRAFCRNVLLVAAADNADFRAPGYPAHFPTVLATDGGALEGLALRRREGELVEFVARGERVRAAWRGGGWREVTGTSFAAPHLAALAARLRQLRPGWNACQVKAALYRLASPGL